MKKFLIGFGAFVGTGVIATLVCLPVALGGNDEAYMGLRLFVGLPLQIWATVVAVKKFGG